MKTRRVRKRFSGNTFILAFLLFLSLGMIIFLPVAILYYWSNLETVEETTNK